MQDTGLENALKTASIFGFAVFPVHGIAEFGGCTCGDNSCTNVGKHPACANGVKDATTDPDKIKALFAGRSGLNYGIATGAASKCFVVDIDNADAEAAFYAMGAAPSTLTATTARGKHLFFAYPDFKVKTMRGLIDKVDVRGDGGYVVGAGSIHALGVEYQWVNELEIVAPAPDWLLNLLKEQLTPPRLAMDAATLSLVNQPRANLNLSNSFTRDDIEAMLGHIDPDLGYDDWIMVGMALHHGGYPFTLWDAWSGRGTKYKGQKDLAVHWRSFNTAGGVSLGSLVHLAKRGGWRPKFIAEYTPQAVPIVNNPIAEPKDEFADIADSNPFDLPMQKTHNEPQVIKSRQLYAVKARDIQCNLDCQDFVQGLLGEGQLSVVYGESNVGKTFFIADLSFHVAMGKEWRGKRVEQGAVIYTALEGARGFSNRIEAYFRHNLILDRNMPLSMVPCAVDFLNPNGNIGEFIDLVKKEQDDLGAIKLIVIDTLARAIAGGDENSGQDMGRLVGHADLIRHHTGAHVCFIHHSGKDKARGARGHSSLRAAVDTEIELVRDENAAFTTVRVAKQREMEIGKDMAFELHGVVLGQNRHGEDVTSCVVVPHSLETLALKPRARLSARQDFVYQSIVEAIDSHGVMVAPVYGMKPIKCATLESLRDVLHKNGFAKMVKSDGDLVDEQAVKSSTQAARIELQKKGYIGFNMSYVWLLERN